MAKNIDLQFKELHKALAALTEEVKTLKEILKESANKILTESDMMRLLGVGDKTLRSYRANGLISYSQLGRKFFYRMKDVEKMLNEARIEADNDNRA